MNFEKQPRRQEQTPGRRQSKAETPSVEMQKAAWQLGSAAERAPSAPQSLKNEFAIAEETGRAVRIDAMLDISQSIKTGAPVSLKSLLILESIKEEVADQKIKRQMKMQEDPTYGSGFAASERRLSGLYNLIDYIENHNEKTKQDKAA